MGLGMNRTSRTLLWIHLALSLLIPLALIALTGCKEEKKSSKPNFGPEAAPAEIEAALSSPMDLVNPASMQIGEFVHFAETQVLNGRSDAEAVISDTGQTVVDRVEAEDRIVYTVVQNKITYSGDEHRKSSTELEMVVPKAQQATISEFVADDASTVDSGVRNASEFSLEEHARHVITNSMTPLKTMTAVFAAESARRVSYHNLRVSTTVVKPPAQVASQADCLGIPSCQIRLHKIAFDQVVWESESLADKVAFEFTMSPDVPYLATLMDKCATLLVPINADKPKESTKILLRQCSPVLNFQWRQAQSSAP